MDAATALQPTQQPLQPKQSSGSLQNSLAELHSEADQAKAVGETARANIEQDILQGRAMQPPQLSEPPPPVQTNPAQAWGSAAMMVAALGGLMTRNHATNAMNAAAGVMNAFHQGDLEQSQQEFQRWQVSNENMQKMFKFQMDRLNQDVKLWEADEKAGSAALNADFKAFGADATYIRTLDDAKRLQIESGRLQVELEKASQEIPMLYLRNQAAIGLMKSPDWARMSKVQQLMALQGLVKGSLAQSGIALDPDTVKSVAEQTEAGVPNAGAGIGVAGRQMVAGQVAKDLKAKGGTGADIAAAQAKFQGLKAGERAVGTRAAGIGFGLSEMKRLIPMALDASKALPRTNYPTANSVINAYLNNVGDPRARVLGQILNDIRGAYSQVLVRGGTPTDKARTDTEALFRNNDPDYVLKVVLSKADQVATVLQEAPGDVQQDLLNAFAGLHPHQQQPPAPSSDPAKWKGWSHTVVDH